MLVGVFHSHCESFELVYFVEIQAVPNQSEISPSLTQSCHKPVLGSLKPL